MNNLYADIFKAKEEDVKTFADVMRSHRQSGFGELTDEKSVKVKTPEFTMQESGALAVEHGWDGEDYVWHIRPTRGRKWRASDERVIYAIAKILDTVIPRTIRVDIHPPIEDWDIQDYTAKSYGLRAVWNVTDSDLKKLTERMFNVMNTLM